MSDEAPHAAAALVTPLTAAAIDEAEPLVTLLHEHHAAMGAPPAHRVRSAREGWTRRRPRLVAMLEADRGAVLLARDPAGPTGAAPLGLAVVHLLDGDGRNVIAPDGGAGELETLVVADAARGRGVGGALLDAVRAWLRARGGAALQIDVRAENARALEFYVARGARPAVVELWEDIRRTAHGAAAGSDASRRPGADTRGPAAGSVPDARAGDAGSPESDRSVPAASTGADGARSASAAPVADLGLWRTPVEPAPRLAERLGLDPADLLVKRDDWLGHGGGGNKLRKLARLCGAALAEGADVLVTSGAAQSNHARATAAAARRLGLDVVLVLAADGPEPGASGNLALDGLLGARVVWAGAVGDAGHAVLDERLAATVDELRAAGRRPYLVPYGGSDGVGAAGYLDAARELATQVPDLAHVVCAVGSGGTMAGLVAGLGVERVLGVHVGAVAEPEATVRRLLGELDAVEGAARRPEAGLRLRLDQVGDGYGIPTPASRATMEDAALGAGIVLDPVYTAKAMAGLAAEVADGAVRRGQRTVFLHSGGLPGFFGHPLAAELAGHTA